MNNPVSSEYVIRLEFSWDFSRSGLARELTVFVAVTIMTSKTRPGE